LQTGTLRLEGAGTYSGATTLAAGATLHINGGSHTFDASSSISGAGNLSIGNGTAQIAGAYSPSITTLNDGTLDLISNTAATVIFNQSNGTLSGAGKLTLNGSGSWTGGVWQGGGTLIVSPGSTLDIDGTSAKYLNGYTVDNSGTVNWKNSGAVDLNLDSSTSTFNNRGAFDIQGNGSWGNVFCCQSGSFTLINHPGATIRRTASAATDTATFTLGTKLENQSGASIDLQNGVLQLNGELLQSGAIKTAATATLRKLDGFANQSGGMISGHGTIDVGANTLTNHGVIAPGDASQQALSLDSGMSTAMAVVAPPRIGTLTVKGNLLQSTGGHINLDIAGPGSNDLIAVTGQATLDGTLMIDQLGYTPTEGETFNGISAAGVTGKFTTVNSPLRSYYEAGYDASLVRMTYLVAQGTNFWLLDSDGLWDNTANWSLGIPLSGQKVVIDRPSGSYTVTLPSGNSYAIASLNSQENLTLQGSLTVSGDDMSGATVAILGGALTVNGNLSVMKLALNSGSLSVLGDLNIGDSFAYSGGAVSGQAANINIAHTSGNLAVPTMNASNSIKLLAKAGRVELLGNLTTTADTGYIVIGGAQGMLNNAGANALTVGSKGRWLVVAPDPASVTKNGLTSDFRYYNAQLSDFKPENVVEKGNGFIYAAPAGTLTVTPVLSRQSQIYGDVATLEVGYTLSGFADNEDTASNIGLSGLTEFTLPPLLLQQAHAGNYNIAYTGGLTSAQGYTFAAAPSQTYTIAPRPLGLSVSGSKIYDHSTALDSAIFSLSNITNDDNLFATGSVVFADNANAGSNKPLIASGLALSGAAAANYSLAETATGVGSILPRPIGVGGLGVDNKVYDGTSVATANGQAIFANLIVGDKVALGAVSARFGDANVGSKKTASFGDLTLTGADAGNYILESRPLTATADIAPRPLGLTLSGSKVYDGTTSLDAPVYVLSNVVAGDALSVSGAASFADNANVGSSKPLIAGKPTLSGAAAANYTLADTVAGLGEISPRPLSLTLAGSKVYDRSTTLDTPLFTLANRIDGDALDVAAKVVFSDNANVGSNKPLTAQDIVLKGSAAANYSIAATATGSGKIEPKALNLTVSGSKTFDATSVLPAPTFTLEGLLGDDAVTVGGSVGFKDAFVGANKAIVGETALSGAAAANYVIGSTGSKAEIKADPTNFVWSAATSGAWETPGHWNQGVVPVDGASVTLPALDAAISFNQGSATLKTLTSLSSLIVSGGNLRLGETGAELSSFGAATQLTVAGGTLIVDGRLDAPRLSLNSGAIAGTGILNVGQEFLNNAANNFAATFRELNLNRSGDFAANESYTASQELHLNSSSGGIQSLLKAPKLELSAKNTIDIRSQATFVEASSSNGNIAIDNTGALTTLGIAAELGSVAVTARSPLTIAGEGINAGGAIRLAAVASSAGADNLTIDAKVATTRRIDPAAGISLAAGSDLIVKAKLDSNGGIIAKTAGGKVIDPINLSPLPVDPATIDNNVVASQRAVDRAANPEKSENKPPAPPPPVDSNKLGGNLPPTPQKMTVGGDENSFGAKEPSLPPPPSAARETKAEDKPAPSAAKESKPEDKPVANAKEQKSDDKPADDEGKKEKKERADSKEEKKEEESKPAAKKLAQCS
ncbi:MAG TPA: YDG domain-containing protein, partial [Rhodocyclaceae bacterium]|nr:YDG domain-containing protein [Rhodocyclaceae bacterium]